MTLSQLYDKFCKNEFVFGIKRYEVLGKMVQMRSRLEGRECQFWRTAIWQRWPDIQKELWMPWFEIALKSNAKWKKTLKKKKIEEFLQNG